MLHDRAGWLERTDLGRLWVRGEDRRTYLHGLLTNDVERLSAGEACYAALLTPQGRMISDMHLFETGDALLVTLPRNLAGRMGERLDQFVFSEDVRIEDWSETTVQIGVYGPRAEDAVRGLPHPDSLVATPATGFGLQGAELILPAAGKQVLLEALASSGVSPVSYETAEVCRIEAGVPRFLVDMTDDTIPLEAGIEDRAISMTKGCYVGQEVIIRVLHRGGGRVARRLVQLAFAAAGPAPAPGAALRSGEREVGSITSAAHSPTLDRPIALGYVHRDFAAAGTRVTAILASGEAADGEVLPR